jgi:hypothetical protein
MNEFTAKKFGEVLAFCRVDMETIEKGKAAYIASMGQAAVTQTERNLKKQAEAIENAATRATMIDTTKAKSEATGTKLRAMRDMYVGDEWDNPAELMEWAGFFEGAAIVHWQLVEGAAETLRDATLQALAKSGTKLHQDLLTKVGSAIQTIGATKAKG